MLLASLIRFAERKGLAVDPAFELKAVDFLLRIDGQGRFLGAIDRRETKGKRLVGTTMEVPRLPKRTVGVSAGLLVDNVKYVLGVGDEGDRPGRLLQCAQAFRQRVEELTSELGGDAGLEAVLGFLGNDTARRQAATVQAAWTGSEFLAFQLASDNEPVHHRVRVRAAIGAVVGVGDGMGQRCLVTGRLGSVARLHPTLKRVPSGQSSGTSLVSFNGPAFTSHGLSQGDNAPVSEEAAVSYTTALNYMLEATDTRPYRLGIRLGGSAVLLIWTDADGPFADRLVETMDPPYLPKEETAGRARKRRVLVAASTAEGSVELLAEAPWRRLTAPAPDDSQIGLYGVVLSGNAARAVVRDAFTTTVLDVKTHVRQWFSGLALRRDGLEESPTIPMILTALAPPGNGELPPGLSAKLAVAALWGRALPAELLRHALVRFRREDRGYLVFSRAAVIKACLVTLSPPRLKETDVSLDELNNDHAYLLGRLFACLEKAQENALPGLNATIRDRYFTAASTSP
jgi:CRISPR-associated protein Csd1